MWRNPAYAGEARLLPALGGAVPTLRRSELGQRIDVESTSTAGGPSPAGPSAGGATGGAASLLVTDEQWDAGWSVEVDGQAATPRAVDGFFLGVELPPGARHATFRYRPVHARLGLAISAAGLALGALLAAGDGWPTTLRRRTDAGSRSDCCLDTGRPPVAFTHGRRHLAVRSHLRPARGRAR